MHKETREFNSLRCLMHPLDLKLNITDLYFMVFAVNNLTYSSVFDTAKAGKSSGDTLKDKPETSKLSSSFADPGKVVEEILERMSAIVLSEVSRDILFCCYFMASMVLA